MGEVHWRSTSAPTQATERACRCHVPRAPPFQDRHNVANALVASIPGMACRVSGDTIQRVADVWRGAPQNGRAFGHPQPCTSTTTRTIPQSSKPCLTPSASVGPNVKSPLCFSLICTPERAILVQEFARVLGVADRVFLLPIYPAREAPIPGVDAQWLFDNISSPHKHLDDFRFHLR